MGTAAGLRAAQGHIAAHNGRCAMRSAIQPLVARRPTPAIFRGMAESTSSLDPIAMAHARALLARPVRPQRIWPVLAAAGFLAVSALAFATAMILAPPLHTQHLARVRGAT
jgi:hypothetical protein